MGKIESIEQWVQEQEAAAHVSTRFALALMRRKGAINMKSIADTWKNEDGSALGQSPGATMYLIGKDAFRAGVQDHLSAGLQRTAKDAILVDASNTITSEEIDEWFEEEMKEQIAKGAAVCNRGVCTACRVALLLPSPCISPLFSPANVTPPPSLGLAPYVSLSL